MRSLWIKYSELKFRLCGQIDQVWFRCLLVHFVSFDSKGRRVNLFMQQVRGRDSCLPFNLLGQPVTKRAGVGKVANFMLRLFRLGRKAVLRFSALLVIWHRLCYEPAGALAVITKLDEFPRV